MASAGPSPDPPKDKEKALQDLFYLLDKDDIGKISTKDLPLALFSIGVYPDRREQEEFIAKVENSAHSSTFIDYAQFRDAMDPLYRATARADLTDSLRVLDGGEGMINVEDLLYTMETVGDPIPREDVQRMMQEHFLQDDGRINFEEFVDLLMSD